MSAGKIVRNRVIADLLNPIVDTVRHAREGITDFINVHGSRDRYMPSLDGENIFSEATWDENRLPECNLEEYTTRLPTAIAESDRNIAEDFIVRGTISTDQECSLVDRYIDMYNAPLRENERILEANKQLIERCYDDSLRYVKSKIATETSKSPLIEDAHARLKLVERKKGELENKIEELERNIKETSGIWWPSVKIDTADAEGAQKTAEADCREKKRERVVALKKFARELLCPPFVKFRAHLRHLTESGGILFSVVILLSGIICFDNILYHPIPYTGLRLMLVLLGSCTISVLPYFLAKHITKVNLAEKSTVLVVVWDCIVTLLLLGGATLISYHHRDRFIEGDSGIMSVGIALAPFTLCTANFFTWFSKIKKHRLQANASER